MFEIVRIERSAETPGARLGRLLLGGFLLTLGVALVGIFSVAIVWELMDGTFFGLCLCMMIVTFGLLLGRDGIARLTGLRVQLRPQS